MSHAGSPPPPWWREGGYVVRSTWQVLMFPRRPGPCLLVWGGVEGGVEGVSKAQTTSRPQCSRHHALYLLCFPFSSAQVVTVLTSEGRAQVITGCSQVTPGTRTGDHGDAHR